MVRENPAMGLFDKAKEAADHAAERARGVAEQAAERATGGADRAPGQARGGSGQAGDSLRAAAGQARAAAGQLGKATSDAVSRTATAVADPTNQAHARDAAQRGLKRAKSGVASMIDRIDPGLLADIVIKATSLQEKANRRLREKHSPYRINEITLTAGLPPDVAFTIGRIEVEEEDLSTGTEAEGEIRVEPVPADAVLDESGLGFVDEDTTLDDPEAPLGEVEVGIPVMDPQAVPSVTAG
jgi:hypothetical protein